jgi:hypothetical protein
MVPLTWPLSEPDKTPADREVLVKYKRSFIQEGVWAAVLHVIIKLIAVPFSKRSENDHARLRLLLCLIRNVLAIRDSNEDPSRSNEMFFNSTVHVL